MIDNMIYVCFFCGRVNTRFSYTKDSDEQKCNELIKTIFENKQGRVNLIKIVIEQIKEKEPFSEEYQQDTDYALEHDEFWFLKTKDANLFINNIDISIKPTIRFANVKDKLNEYNVYIDNK